MHALNAALQEACETRVMLLFLPKISQDRSIGFQRIGLKKTGIVFSQNRLPLAERVFVN